MAEVLYDSLFVIVKHELFSFPKWETSRLVVEEKRIVMKMDSQESSNDVSELQAIDSICPCARRWLGHELPLITCKCWRVKMNPWVYWLLLNELRRSTNFRINVIRNILRSRSISWYRLKLVCPHSGAIHLPVRIIVRTTSDNCIAIDRLWSDRLDVLIQERLELDETMACLSTLGGAFSSLGDQYVHHAETAGRISLRQMRIALKLGDPILLSKCKLFLALSLMQRGRITLPKRIIKEQYNYAKNLPENSKDIRLENMCKGAWVKLQFIHKANSREC